MRTILFFCFLLGVSAGASAQSPALLQNLTRPHNYVLHRVSSYDRTGGNHDYRSIPPGGTLTILDENGPGEITHVWITIDDSESYSLKKIVLRMYWDGESSPSVLAPIGDFFGLGLGEYVNYDSLPLQVAPDKALNCFFPMPFERHARITVTNQGTRPVDAIYWNIDFRAYSHPLPPGTLYFHAEYRQATPNIAHPRATKNLDGKNNYVWLVARGRGQFVGVTMSVIENSDGWWGEGDDMFFVDGQKLPSINGTGTEDYFLGAWDFGDRAFSYPLYGAPVAGPELQGSRWSVYRFNLDSPITFTKSLRATIEHGTADDRGDSYFSVAYWYQTQPHLPLPALPPVNERIPRVIPARPR